MNKDLLKLAESAILVAMAVVIELIFSLMPSFPYGGRVTLTLLPLIILAYRNGIIYGTLGGIVYGLVNFLIDGYTFHWGSIFFDYLIAFGVVGVAGIFRNALRGNLTEFIVGIIVVFLLRYLSHSISGVLFFAEYAGDNNVWLYSFILYNLPYCAASCALCVVVGCILYKRLLKMMNKDF